MGCTMGHAKCSGQIAVLEGADVDKMCGANMSWHLLNSVTVSALMACCVTICERAPGKLGGTFVPQPVEALSGQQVGLAQCPVCSFLLHVSGALALFLVYLYRWVLWHHYSQSFRNPRDGDNWCFINIFLLCFVCANGFIHPLFCRGNRRRMEKCMHTSTKQMQQTISFWGGICRQSQVGQFVGEGAKMLVGWHVGQLTMLGKELRLAQNTVSMCFWNVVHIAMIMVHGRTEIPFVDPSGCPWPSSIAILVLRPCNLEEQGGIDSNCTTRRGFHMPWCMHHIKAIQYLGGEAVPQWSRKSKSVVVRAAMKASLNVWITRSAALILWLWGSTSCSLHSSLVRFFLIYFVAWLSIMFDFGLNPLATNSSNALL